MAQLIEIFRPRRPVEVAALTIKLSIEEAQALIAVLCSVSGPPKTSRRAVVDRILRCLQQSTEGVRATSHADITGSLTFSARRT